MEASALPAPANPFASVGALRRSSLHGRVLQLRSDDQLVAFFREGSEDAFRVIHDRYRQRLFAYTRQMLAGSRQDAEDALQDVFVRAYFALRSDQRPIALRAWLYRVAHNRCIDQLRRPAPPALELLDTARAPLPDPLSVAERREDLQRLISDIRRLPAQQRSVLLMRELEGLSYGELADALAVSVAAVKSLLVRARLGLVQAAEARNAECSEIRHDLALAHGHGVRANGRARRHLHECEGCREYRSALRGMRNSMAALAPVAGGPLALLAKLTGVGAQGGSSAAAGSGGVVSSGGAVASGGLTAGGGTALTSAAAATATKVAAVVASVAVTAGGAVGVEQQLARQAHRAAAPALVSGAVAAPSRAAAHPFARGHAAAPVQAENAPATDMTSSGVNTDPALAPAADDAVQPAVTGGYAAPTDLAGEPSGPADTPSSGTGTATDGAPTAGTNGTLSQGTASGQQPSVKDHSAKDAGASPAPVTASGTPGQ